MMANPPKRPKAPMKTAQGRGLDAKTTADAKVNTALKSMSDRFDNPKGRNAGLTVGGALSRRGKEIDLFRASDKLNNTMKRDQKAGARMGRAQAYAKSKKP